MKSTRLISLSLILVLALITTVDQAQAETFRYRLSGNWTTVTDGTSEGWGLNPNNDGSPGAGVPGMDDEARINFANNTVTVDSVVPEVNRVLMGVDEGGILEVNAGGVLTATQDVIAGNNRFANFDVPFEAKLVVNDGGVVNVGRILWVSRDIFGANATTGIDINTGGTINVVSHLWWGVVGDATVNISGTLNQTGDGILGLGTLNAVDPEPGTATVNILDGGLLALNNIDAGESSPGVPRLGSIQSGSIIDIQGTGRLTLPGNFASVIQNYIDAGRIIGNGVQDALQITVEGGTTAGDFDEDGDVDGQDFLLWQRDTSIGDLAADWEANYGASGGGGDEITIVTAVAPAVSNIQGVPEPATLSLVIIGSIACLSSRRRHR